ncbi:MAG: gliding motility-associated C-terminal domain-containing protein [Chryseolinea sp.]
MARLVLLVSLMMPATVLFGQTTEVLCNNGKDDDGDGIIDCADGNCQFAANIERGCNCYDGKDNDGDGKIDQADSNCAPYFGLTFVGEGSTCSITPPGANTPFDMVGPPAVSGQNTADTQSKVAIGDVDGDGVPDVVITSKWNNEVRVVATTNGQADGSAAGDIKSSYNLSGKKSFFSGLGCDVDRLLLEHEVMIADIDKNGKAELFTIVSNRAGNPKSPPTCFFLLSFRYVAGTLVPLYAPVYLGTNRPGTFGIADMDGDGKAEVYLRDRIFAAETGALLASEGGKLMSDTNLWDSDVTAAPVAVDIKSAGTDGSKLELVVGSKIYKIPTLTARNPAAPAALSLWKDMNSISFDANKDGTPDQYFVKLMNDPVEYGMDTHSSTSVADIDKDGYQDVIVTGAVNSSVGRTAVFYWNVQKGTVSAFLTQTSADIGIASTNNPDYTNYLNGWIWGTGRVNIGDANGDGKLDLSFIAGNQLYCVTTDAPSTNIVALWTSPRTINDSRSGVLTVTIYDFDNDGKPEMVYRDSQELVIIDGTTGQNKLWSAVCQSHTYTEGPVIADANGDGATDICVPCNRNNSFNINADIQQQALGEVRMFFSNGNEWLPTRRVWNQPGYFVVNINDNLTLPFPQLDGSLVFGTSACPNGLPGPQTPFNIFLNQVPFLSSDGCPVFPAPDLSFVGDDPENLPYPAGDPRNFPAVTVTPPICGNLDVKVVFNISNDGDLPITASVPVSFFHGDPTKPGIKPDSLLYSTTIQVSNLQVGDTLTTAPVVFNGPGKAFRLYIVLNNNGSVLPINPAGSVSNECRIDNNIYDVLVTPTPFTATIQKIRDDEKCVPADPNVGEIRAHIFKGDPNVPANEIVAYADYAFQWYYGLTTSNPVPASLGGNNYNLTNLPAGDYTLVATNVPKGCSAPPVSIKILPTVVIPGVTVNVLSDQTVCAPPNGSLEAVVTGGNTGFTFEWYSNAASLGITTATITNRTGNNYSVVVSRNGCTTTASGIVKDLAVEPDVTATATPVQNCQNPNSGSVTADATVGGLVQNPSGFTFKWYFHNNTTHVRGSSLPPQYGTGRSRTGLPVGFYEVETINNSTQCVSLPFVIEVKDQTVTPVVTITELAPQTSCDPLNPNGRLQANVTINGIAQDPANFIFEWFKGQNTLPANKHTTVSGVQGSVAEKVLGGGQSYTVKATTTLQCFATTSSTVSENIQIPAITISATPNSICDPLLAAQGYTGSVTAQVTFGGVAVSDFSNYKLTWYNGSVTTGTPRTETTAVLQPMPSGYYTLTAERTDLGCKSLPQTAQVVDATVLPVITATPHPSTNCDALLANGSVEVTSVDGLGLPSQYKYQWHSGTTTATTVPGATSPKLDKLQGGAGINFTVLVTNSNTGCQRTSTLSLADNHVLPILTLTANPNSICDPALTSPAVTYGGGVAASISNQVGAISDYSFAWSNSAVTQNLTQVKGGSYTLTTTQISTGCISNPATAQVLDQISLPVIQATTLPSTNCIAGLENGEAQVTLIDGLAPASPYAMLWHKGNDLSSPLSGKTSAQLTQRQGGPSEYYTVLVTNQSSGCTNTSTVLIADNRDYPVVTLSSTDNTICTGTPDGSAATATLSYKSSAVASPYTGYSFAWSTGATTSSIANQSAGQYTLVVTKDNVGCASVPVNIDIINNFYIPAIDIAAVNQTSCDTSNPNGVLTATIDETSIGGGTGVNAGYSFDWRDNGTGPALTLPGAIVANNTGIAGKINKLPGNLYYTVSVQRTATGCMNEKTVFLPEVITYPIVVAAATNPVTRCDAPNGSVAANVGGSQSGYTFHWLNETGSNSTPLNTDVVANATASNADNGVYNSLKPGYYTVVAQDNATTCLSQPITREVVDATLQTSINFTLGPNFPSTCGSLDGEMSATVTGGSGGTLDLMWHYGGVINSDINFFDNPPQFQAPDDIPFATAAGLSAPANSAINNLESRLYTLVVKDNGNGCGNYETVFLPFQDAHEIAETLTPSTICPYNVGNGAVEVRVTNIPPVPAGLTFQNFSYSLHTGTNPTASNVINPPGTRGPGASVTDPMTYSSLAPGFYTIEVKQAFGSNCPVYKVVEIDKLALPPVVDLIGALTANTACDITVSNGSAQIAISQDPNDGTTGNTYSLSISPTPLLGSYPQTGLGAGNYVINGMKSADEVSQYVISVTSTNFCTTDRYVAIPNKPAIAQLVSGDIAKTDAEFCDVALETSAQVEVKTISIVNGPADNLSDYRFDWFNNSTLSSNILSAAGDGTAAKGGEILSNVGAPTPGSPVTDGSYWVVATKVNAGATGGLGCQSVPFKVDLLDKHINPVVALTTTANTSCDTNYEGAIEVDVTTASGPGSAPATTYSYQWTSSTGATPPANGSGYTGASDMFNGIRDGQFSIVATNALTGCKASATASVVKMDIPIVITSVTPVDNAYCFDNGSVSVQQVTLNGVAEPNHNLFNFQWFKGSPSTPSFTNGIGLDALTARATGTYYVVAVVDPSSPIGSGCVSPPARADIKDIHINPTVQFSTTPNTACDANFDGGLTATALTSGGPGAAANYDFVWTAGGIANSMNVPGSVSATNLGQGNYSVTVTNTITQCPVNGTVTLLRTMLPMEILTVSKTDQMICLPDGSIQVTAVSPANITDYAFQWYKGSPLSTQLVDGTNTSISSALLNSANYAMGKGTYYVVAKRNAGAAPSSACETAPFRVDIEDKSVNPDVSFANTANSSCTMVNPNGEIMGTAVERDGTTGTYSFSWLLNGGALPPVTVQSDAAATSSLTKASDGNYLLTATNTTTGCVISKDLTLKFDPRMSLPNVVQVDPVNPVDCNPTGSATVVKITIGGNAITDPVRLDADYDYEWYQTNYPTGLIAGADLAQLSNKNPDRYFVLVKDLLTECKSTPVEVNIKDADIIYPSIDIQATAPQVSCDALIGTAVLMAKADNQDDTNPNYTFTWFNGLTASGTSIATGSTLSDLKAGGYSVEVYNATTNCKSQSLYIVPDASPMFKPQLSLSMTERTRCDVPDGVLLANGVPYPVDPFRPDNNYPFPYNYKAELYDGNPPADINNPEHGVMANDPNFPTFTSNFVANSLAEGTYSVRLTDLNTGCMTTGHIDVKDGRVYPTVVVEMDNPLINCDPARPNGQLSATADGGQVGGYSFEWFSGSPEVMPVLSTSNKLIGQTIGTYTVTVKSDITFCATDATGVIKDGMVLPPSPIAELVQGRTSCIDPNGWVKASVGGATLGYDFNWYDGSTVSGSPDYTGTDYIHRDVGPYAVTATDLVTGCASRPAVVEVPDLRVTPEANLTSTPSYCLRPSGSVSLTVVTEGVVLSDIQWFDDSNNRQVSVGPAGYDLPAGYYRAEFTSSEGCVNKGTVEVGTEILSYNLVSANGDNSNDGWTIDCIDNFPQNNVKVFNRSGVKVYEANGYNNLDVIFSGLGERGLYSLGNEVPEGTYFYIIDKRDGSKPITGYLELVR